jgi:hypothetical protein
MSVEIVVAFVEKCPGFICGGQDLTLHAIRSDEVATVRWLQILTSDLPVIPSEPERWDSLSDRLMVLKVYCSDGRQLSSIVSAKPCRPT